MKLKQNKWVWHKLYRTRCFIIQVLKKGKKALVQLPDGEGVEILFKKHAKPIKSLGKQKHAT